jgi:hypothetical protein
MFSKTSGFLSFLDIKDLSAPSLLNQEARAEGFRILSKFIEKMASHDLLRSFAYIIGDIQNICLDTYRRENQFKIKETALDAMTVALTHSADIFPCGLAITVFDELLHSLDMATLSNCRPGVKKGVFAHLGMICKHYAEIVRVTKFSKGSQSLLVTFFDVINSNICTSQAQSKKVLAGCLDGLSVALEKVADDAKAFKKGDLLKNAYIAACRGIDVNENGTDLSMASLNLLAAHSTVFCPWVFQSTLDTIKICENMVACCKTSNNDLWRAAVKAMDCWLGCIRHCSELGTHPDVTKLILYFGTACTEQTHAKQAVVAICGYGALAWAISDVHGR